MTTTERIADLEQLTSSSSVLTIGHLRVYFSYRTPVAFHRPGAGLTSRMNEWGPTTGRHIAHAEADYGARKSGRVTGSEFAAALASALTAVQVTA